MSPGDADFHITFWVKFTSLPASQQLLVSKFASSGNYEYAVYYANGDGHLYFIVSNNGTATAQVQASTFGAVTTATWYFVEAYHDSANDVIGIGINGGTRDTLAHSTGVFGSAASFVIGASGVPDQYTDGIIDAVGFFE